MCKYDSNTDVLEVHVVFTPVEALEKVAGNLVALQHARATVSHLAATVKAARRRGDFATGGIGKLFWIERCHKTALST